MERRRFGLAACAIAIAMVATALYVNAGSLTPPAGSVAPTMKTLDQLSSEIAAVQSAVAALPGGIKRVVRGVIDVQKDTLVGNQTFSPAVDPAKSLVTLSDAVATANPLNDPNWSARQGTCLLSLTTTQITVRVDVSNNTAPMQVSYQIVEYN
jgi:hypothetical protein